MRNYMSGMTMDSFPRIPLIGQICVVLAILLSCQLFQWAKGSATVQVTFINFRNLGGYDRNGRHCDPIFNRACDNVFRICIDARNGSNSLAECAYFKGKTGEYTNNDDITFDCNMMGIANPIVFGVDLWKGLKLKVEVIDDDSGHVILPAHDSVDELFFAYYSDSPGPNGTFNTGSREVIRGTPTRQRPTSLTVKFQVKCDVTFYGYDCSVQCMPQDDEEHGHFTCDSKGNMICLPGWTDRWSNCTTPRIDCKSVNNPCLNNGTCMVPLGRNREPQCDCHAGFTGRRCEVKTHGPCLVNVCFNGGICTTPVSGLSGVACICPSSFEGDRCEFPRRNCTDTGCENGGSCVMGKCVCRTGTRGSSCQYIYTTPRTIIHCLNGGTFSRYGVCLCSRGFAGRLCEKNLSSLDTGSLRGRRGSTPRGASYTAPATRPVTSARPTRPHRWPSITSTFHGAPTKDSSNNNNHTTTVPYIRATTGGPGLPARPARVSCGQYWNRCRNGGYCTSGRRCRCLSGYLGDLCEVKLCDHISCYNGGRCLAGVCTCEQGYSGLYCQDQVNPRCELFYYGANCKTYCKPQDNRRGHYRCDPSGRKVCLPGWEDAAVDCTVLSDDCVGHKCQNGASCQDEDRSYSCICSAGFTGTYCEIEVDECLSNPCHNGGVCRNLINRFECACPDDYPRHLSATCGLHVCNHDSTTQCQNGGTCHGSGQCSCPLPYTGSRCELILCEVLPCHNGGRCEDGRCTCPSPYTGSHCHMVTGSCKRRPCGAWGRCVQDAGAYSCVCKEGAMGDHCQYKGNNGTTPAGVQPWGVADGSSKGFVAIAEANCPMHPYLMILLGLILVMAIIILLLIACLCREKQHRKKLNKVVRSAPNATSNFRNPTYAAYNSSSSSGRRARPPSGDDPTAARGAYGGSEASSLPGVKTISMVNNGLWDMNKDANYVFGLTGSQNSTKWAPGGAVDCCSPPPYSDVADVGTAGQIRHGGLHEDVLEDGVNPRDFDMAHGNARMADDTGEEDSEYADLDDIDRL